MKLSLLHKKYLQKLIKCTKFDENNTTNKKCVLQYVIKLLDYSIPDTDYIKPTCDFLTDHIQLWILLVVAKFGYLSHAVPQTDREKIMFSALFRSIANSMYSILVLSKKGLDYSAQSLLRTLMEQFFVLLSVTNDRDKRMAYLDNYGGKDANTSWYKNFKKEKFIAMIKEYFDDDFLKKQFILNTVITHHLFIMTTSILCVILWYILMIKKHIRISVDDMLLEKKKLTQTAL